MEQNNSTELFGYKKIKIYDESDPPTPQTPNPQYSRIFYMNTAPPCERLDETTISCVCRVPYTRKRYLRMPIMGSNSECKWHVSALGFYNGRRNMDLKFKTWSFDDLRLHFFLLINRRLICYFPSHPPYPYILQYKRSHCCGDGKDTTCWRGVFNGKWASGYGNENLWTDRQ